MRIERKVLAMVAFPLCASVICAQDAGANYLIHQQGQASGNQFAYTIGIASPKPKDSVANFGTSDNTYSEKNPVAPDKIALAADVPSTTDSGLALATVSDQLKILEKFLLDRNYTDQNFSQRLDRLEMLIFRAHQEGSPSERVKKLISSLPEPSKTQVTSAIASLVSSAPVGNPLAAPPPPPAQETWFRHGVGFEVQTPTLPQSGQASSLTPNASQTSPAPVLTSPVPDAGSGSPTADALATALPSGPASINLPSPVLTQPAVAAHGTANGGSALETSADQLSALETFFFDCTYPSQTDSQRLDRIETLVFGGPRTGAEAERLKNVIATLPPQTKKLIDKSIAVAIKTAPAVSPLAAAPVTGQHSSATPSTPVGHSDTQVAIAQPGTATTGSEKQMQTNPTVTADTIFSALEKLVKQFYPSAKVTASEGKLHFEYKCKNEIGYYSQRKEYTPDYGGILGNISVEPGEYNKPNKNRLPSEVEDGFHTNLTMAPYSSSLNENLLSQLSFPPDVDLRFKGRFERIINGFNAQDLQANAAAATAQRVAVAQHAAATKAGIAEQQRQLSLQFDENYQKAYGAPSLSEHNFSDGQFRVMLPDVIQTRYTGAMGLAETEYSAQATGGSFVVSYFKLPSLPSNGAATDALLDKFGSAAVQQINGSDVEQGFITLKGCPGRQMSVGSINGKPGNAALIRLYIADLSTYSNSPTDQGGATSVVSPNYVLFEVIAVGEQQWLGSPAVQSFTSSFEFYCGGASGQWTDSNGQQHWLDTNGWDHWKDRQGQEHVWDQKHLDRKLGVKNWH